MASINSDELSKYIRLVIEPTFDDFRRERTSRRAFLACVAIYHAIDRAALPKGGKVLLQKWRKESLEFTIIDLVAHHFKHVRSDNERVRSPPDVDAIQLWNVLAFSEDGYELELHSLYFVMRDAIAWLSKKAAASGN